MKKILIIILIFILVPILALVGLYYTVDPVKDKVDEAFKYLPGSLGESYRNKPTSEELDKQVREVAVYILDFKDDRAVDKLQLTESKDEKTYNLLIKHMMRLNPNKTTRLLELVRQSKLQKSPIQETLDKIQEEMNQNSKDTAEFIATLSSEEKVRRVRNMLDREVYPHETVAKIFEFLPEDDVVVILTYLSDEDRDLIFENMDHKKVVNFKSKLYAKINKLKSIVEVAALLKTKPAGELATLIGPGSKYEGTELTDIYRSLGPKKAGEVLAKVKSSEFREEIIKKIKNRENLVNGADKFTEDLIYALKIYSEFDDNLSNLQKVYVKLDETQVAQTIKTLYWNSKGVKNYQLKNGEKIIISDKDLALELLKSFGDKKAAGILSHIDNKLSSDIFTKLALPK